MGEQILRPAGEHSPGARDRKGPIVQTGRVRRSGSRRQAVIASFVVLTIAGLLVAGYFLFLPREDAFVLREYATSTAVVETLQETVDLSGTVAARNNATVTAPEQGFLEAMLAAEGDLVTAGQLIAILDAESLQDSRTTLQRTLERDQREYERFLLQHEYSLRSLDRERDALAKELEEAEESLETQRDLLGLGSATASSVTDAEDAVEDARYAIEDHDATVEETVALYELSVQNYEDDIRSVEEEIADIDARLADTRITAPISGRIVSVSDAASTSGELLTQYTTILEIANTSNPVILAEIEEQYVPSIQSGQPVAVEVTGVRYPGEIERIGQIASSGADGGTPTVEIDVVIPQVGELIPGTSALLEVLIGEVDDAVVLPRGPYLTSGNRRYLFVIEGDTARRVEVTYGEITESRVQIVNGVQPGELVIISSYQSFVDRQQIEIGDSE